MTQQFHIPAGRPLAMTLGVVDVGFPVVARPEEMNS
jgi:hypothetical protein